MAGGHFYLGGGTAVQQATGIEDSAEEMFKYLMAVSLDPDEDKIRAFCDDSVEHFDWIEALGMRVRALALPGEGGDPARHPGADVHRQREGAPVPRHRQAGTARAQGAQAR